MADDVKPKEEEAEIEEEETEEEPAPKPRRKVKPRAEYDWGKDLADLDAKIERALGSPRKETGIPGWLFVVPVAVLFLAAIVPPVIDFLRNRKAAPNG